VSDQDKDKRIEELTELVRCLRASRDLYRSETYALRDRISELEQTNDQLNDDNMNLSAMNRSAYAKLFAMQREERERLEVAA
jgi:hypothetical protein